MSTPPPESRHTPGPWQVGGDGRTVLTAGGHRHRLVTITQTIRAADAALIAAAPDLLFVLRQLLALPASERCGDEIEDLIRAAVDRARGPRGGPVPLVLAVAEGGVA